MYLVLCEMNVPCALIKFLFTLNIDVSITHMKIEHSNVSQYCKNK